MTAAAPTRHVDVCCSCVHRNTEPVLFCSAKLDWIQEKQTPQADQTDWLRAGSSSPLTVPLNRVLSLLLLAQS